MGANPGSSCGVTLSRDSRERSLAIAPYEKRRLSAGDALHRLAARANSHHTSAQSPSEAKEPSQARERPPKPSTKPWTRSEALTAHRSQDARSTVHPRGAPPVTNHASA